MIDPKIFDELARKVSANVPSGIRELQQDLDKNLHAALQASLSKLDLVTHEEFEVQRLVLEKTRKKLKEMERRVTELEAQIIK
ncbi:MAG: accessory factor UbiK family protein [Gammaproteobacteria bacterium]|nr:accessory factor UbiK family protein [Gammaproteobacteria bacterium]